MQSPSSESRSHSNDSFPATLFPDLTEQEKQPSPESFLKLSCVITPEMGNPVRSANRARSSMELRTPITLSLTAQVTEVSMISDGSVRILFIVPLGASAVVSYTSMKPEAFLMPAITPFSNFWKKVRRLWSS